MKSLHNQSNLNPSLRIASVDVKRYLRSHLLIPKFWIELQRARRLSLDLPLKLWVGSKALQSTNTNMTLESQWCALDVRRYDHVFKSESNLTASPYARIWIWNWARPHTTLAAISYLHIIQKNVGFQRMLYSYFQGKKFTYWNCIRFVPSFVQNPLRVIPFFVIAEPKRTIRLTHHPKNENRPTDLSTVRWKGTWTNIFQNCRNVLTH